MYNESEWIKVNPNECELSFRLWKTLVAVFGRWLMIRRWLSRWAFRMLFDRSEDTLIGHLCTCARRGQTPPRLPTSDNAPDKGAYNISKIRNLFMNLNQSPWLTLFTWKFAKEHASVGCLNKIGAEAVRLEAQETFGVGKREMHSAELKKLERQAFKLDGWWTERNRWKTIIPMKTISPMSWR